MAERRGFSLVEVVVVLAIMGILAGTMAPLAGRVLEQRRIAATRRLLKTAFEACFGSRERRIPNMLSDYGFQPTRDMPNLPHLLSKRSIRAPYFDQNDHASFPWGWNGPYWQGPVVENLPADAWGRPIRLKAVDTNAGRTWQVVSSGPRLDSRLDDIVYPPTPARAASFEATLVLTVRKVSPRIGGWVYFRHLGGEMFNNLRVQEGVLQDGLAVQTFVFTGMAGGAELEFHPDPAAPRDRTFRTYQLPMGLLPGRIREIEVAL